MQLSVKQVAGFLNISEKTLYQWIEQKKIPVYQINEQIRFNRSELLEWASAQGIALSPALFTLSDDQSEEPPTLVEALELGGVYYNISGTDQASVLHAVVQYLPLPKDIDPEFFYQILLARESMGTTAVGDGVAIPHVRHPLIFSIVKPSVTLCFLKNPIDFHALDRKPITTLFTLVSPTIQTHLQLLARLSYALNSAAFRTLLKQCAPAAEIVALLKEIEAALPTT